MHFRYFYSYLFWNRKDFPWILQCYFFDIVLMLTYYYDFMICFYKLLTRPIEQKPLIHLL